MDFDLNSMKMRAKKLTSKAVPNVLLVSLVTIIVTYIGTIAAGMSLQGNIWGVAVACAIGIAIGLLKLGYKQYMLHVAREKTKSFVDLFYGFRKHIIKNCLIIIICVASIYLGFCLFVVPGVLLFYRWRFVYYILVDEERPLLEVFKQSMDITKGHCIEMLKIDISFIGWHILNVFTMGVAGIYVGPYTTITYAGYYDYLKGQKEFFK